MVKILLPLFIFFLAACGTGQEATETPVFKEINDFYGKKVAAATGSYQEAVLEAEHPQVEVLRFDSDADLLNSLLTRRCDAIAMDFHIFSYFKQVMDDLVGLKDTLFTAEMGFCFGKGMNIELREQFNEFLAKLKEDGVYDEIVERWIFNAHTSQMPEIDLPVEGKPIRVSTSSISPPMCFIKDGKLVGLDVEIINRFSAAIGRPVVWSDMNFSALMPSLVSGTQDMAAAGINITEQRKESVDFSDPYYGCISVMVIRQENSEGYDAGSVNKNETGIIQSFITSVKRNIFEENRYLLILEGLKVTSWISLLSCLFGTLLGALVCWMRMCRFKYIQLLASSYINLMRGTPVLVLLMIMFYVVFAGTSLNPIMVAVVTFGMNFAAYVSEMFRSSIESVDRGQTEAGIALGFTPLKTFIYIIMPQAFKQVMPVFKGEVISLIKTTSIVGFIAVQDLTKVGDIIRSRTFDAFFPLIMIAVLYFILSWIFSVVLDYIGKKVC